MNPAIKDLERAITKFQDELLEDAETFRASLEAFRKPRRNGAVTDILRSTVRCTRTSLSSKIPPRRCRSIWTT